jgi:hypothetical protein
MGLDLRFRMRMRCAGVEVGYWKEMAGSCPWAYLSRGVRIVIFDRGVEGAGMC